MSNNDSVSGMSYPTMQATAAGNPRDSAIASADAMNAKQNSANQMTAGAKKRKMYAKRKIGGAVAVPQFTMSYAAAGGPGQDPNSLIAGNSQTSTQAAANSEFDNNAVKELKGGSRRRKGGSRRRKGGNPDWIWGCFSGGGKKRKTRTNKRKTRRHRKKTRRYKK
jgi:hypothetical protein